MIKITGNTTESKALPLVTSKRWHHLPIYTIWTSTAPNYGKLSASSTKSRIVHLQWFCGVTSARSSLILFTINNLFIYVFVFLTSCEMKKLGPHMRKQKQNQVNKLTITFTVRYLCLININERCCRLEPLQVAPSGLHVGSEWIVVCVLWNSPETKLIAVFFFDKHGPDPATYHYTHTHKHTLKKKKKRRWRPISRIGLPGRKQRNGCWSIKTVNKSQEVQSTCGS